MMEERINSNNFLEKINVEKNKFVFKGILFKYYS